MILVRIDKLASESLREVVNGNGCFTHCLLNIVETLHKLYFFCNFIFQVRFSL